MRLLRSAARGARDLPGATGHGLLRSRPVFTVSLAALVLVVLACTVGSLLYGRDPLAVNAADRLLAPSGEHLLGTDRFGRDVLSRLLHGGQVSLGVAAGSVLVAVVVGGVLGLCVAYLGGWLDQVIMRLMDVMFALPSMLLAIVLAVALGPSAVNAGLAIAIIYVPVFARVVRGAALVEMGKTYVEALGTIGTSTGRLIGRHLLPNVSTPVTVQVGIAVANAVLLESALSFLGLGAQPPAASWGSILGEGRVLLVQAPWIVLSSSAVLIVTVLLLYVVSDGMRDLLDPRSR